MIGLGFVLSLSQILQRFADIFFLVRLGIVTKLAGDNHGFRDQRVDVFPMAAFAGTKLKPCSFQVFDKLANLAGHKRKIS